MTPLHDHFASLLRGLDIDHWQSGEPSSSQPCLNSNIMNPVGRLELSSGDASDSMLLDTLVHQTTLSLAHHHIRPASRLGDATTEKSMPNVSQEEVCKWSRGSPYAGTGVASYLK